MGIYDNRIDLDDRKMQIAGLVIAAIIIIAAILYLTSASPAINSENPLQLSFEKNPVKSGQTTNVTVKVTNIFDKDLADVPLDIFAKEKTEFDIFALNDKFEGTIPVLSKGTQREVTFVVNSVGNVLPGTYVIVARTAIDGKEYEKEAVLTVQ